MQNGKAENFAYRRSLPPVPGIIDYDLKTGINLSGALLIVRRSFEVTDL
jgi:hypothetical protein